MPVIPPLTPDQVQVNQARFQEKLEALRAEKRHLSPWTDGQYLPPRDEVVAVIRDHGFSALSVSGIRYEIETRADGSPVSWVGGDGKEYVVASPWETTAPGTITVRGPRRILRVDRLRFGAD